MFFPTVLLLSFASVVNAQNDDFALLDDGQIDELRSVDSTHRARGP